jgi:hypothetical protein
VSSLDQLNGVPCDSGAGTASLSYGSNGAVSITCVTPTPTSSGSSTATPDNTESTAVSLNVNATTLGGGSAQAEGDNLSGTSAWYILDNSITYCTVTVSLSGNNSGDSFSVWSGHTGSEVLGSIGEGSSSGFFAEVPFEPYYIAVTGGTAGAVFTLTVTASQC